MSKIKVKNAPNKGLIIFAVVAAVLLLACAVVGVTIANCTFTAEEKPAQTTPSFVSVVDSNNEKNKNYLSELREMADLSDILSTWAGNNNDSLMFASNATNYLLVCADGGSEQTNFGNADIVTLVSVNEGSDTVNVVNFDRDMLVYIESLAGATYAKLNATYANGGIDMLKRTIEINFKIRIDHYMTFNMDTLAKAVDGVGGVTYSVSQELADMVNKDFNVAVPTMGSAKLTGQHVVSLLREKRDGTAVRSKRQADLLASVINEIKGYSIMDGIDIVKVLAETCRTDLRGADLIAALKQTVFGGWSGYTVVAFTIPGEANAQQYKDSDWILIVDIPVEAQTLHKRLYTTSNISLNTNRLSSLDVISAVNKLFNDEAAKNEPVTTPDAPADDNDEPAADDEPVVDEEEVTNLDDLVGADDEDDYDYGYDYGYDYDYDYDYGYEEDSDAGEDTGAVG